MGEQQSAGLRPAPGCMPEQVRSTDQGPAAAPMDVWLSVRSSLRCGTHLIQGNEAVMEDRKKILSKRGKL